MFTRIILTGAAGIRPQQTEAGKKRSAQYRRLKAICAAAKKLRIFGSLPEKAEEALRQKYGSRDYNALDAEMRLWRDENGRVNNLLAANARHVVRMFCGIAQVVK